MSVHGMPHIYIHNICFDQLVQTNPPRPTRLNKMLPSIGEIIPENDEASILSGLVFWSLLHNEIQMTNLKSPGGVSTVAP